MPPMFAFVQRKLLRERIYTSAYIQYTHFPLTFTTIGNKEVINFPENKSFQDTANSYNFGNLD